MMTVISHPIWQPPIPVCDHRYTGRPGGSLAEPLGLDTEVEPMEAAAMLVDVPGRVVNDAGVAMYEMVFSTVRSWSVLWGVLAEEDLQNAMSEGFDLAVAAFMGRFEAVASAANLDADPNSASGLLWYQFDHFQSPKGAPDRHTHVLVATAGVDPHERTYRLDDRAFRTALGPAPAQDVEYAVREMTNARVTPLGAHLNYSSRPSIGRTGVHGEEIDGVPDELLRDGVFDS